MKLRSWRSGVRWLTLAVVGSFLAVLGWYLGQPGYTVVRLMVFVVLGGLAVAGAAGILTRRPVVTVGSVCGLLLLGFWQAVLWIYVFPVCGVLLLAAVAVADERRPP